MIFEDLGFDRNVRDRLPGRAPRGTERGPGSRAITVLLAAMVAACSGGAGTARPSVVPASAGERPPSPSPGLEPMQVVVDGRPVAVRVPATLSPQRPASLVIVLHGYGSSGRGHEDYFHLGAAADRRGVITAYPDGTVDSDGNRFWNATDACCDFDRRRTADDQYLEEVITAIGARLAVDPKRIFLLGHSNGGFMSYRMACEHADRIAAIVSLAGASYATPADCAPSSPVSVLQIHGTLDDVVLFKGGTLRGFGSGAVMGPYPGAEGSAGSWAEYDGCDASSTVASERVDVDAELDAAGARAETSITRWTGCERGSAVELWTIPDGSHGPTISTAFPDAVLDFLEAHPKP
jgi:polyhydroxybutyrate depolymerase